MIAGSSVWVLMAVLIAGGVLLSRLRGKRRQEETSEFANRRGLAPAGEENPFLGSYAPAPPKAGASGVSIAETRPYLLEALAGGRGSLRNMLRGSGLSGEILLFDYRMPLSGGSDHHSPFITWAAFNLPNMPVLLIMPRPRFSIGMNYLELAEAPTLSKRFGIQTPKEDEARLRACLGSPLVAALSSLEAKKSWQLSAGGDWLFVSFGLATGGDLDLLLDTGERVALAFRDAIHQLESSTQAQNQPK